MGLFTYDPKDVSVTVAGVPISGYAEDTFVNVSRADDLFTTSVGTQGETTRIRSNNRSGEIELTLQQTSPSNDHLMSLYALDENSNSGVVPVIISESRKGLNIGSKVVSAFSWIKKIPNLTYAKGISSRVWVFSSSNVIIAVAGSSPESN